MEVYWALQNILSECAPSPRASHGAGAGNVTAKPCPCAAAEFTRITSETAPGWLSLSDMESQLDQPAHPTRNSLHLLAVPPVAADAINSAGSLSLLKEPKVFSPKLSAV